jgi:NAD(P)H-hydrate epimerase
MRSFDAAAIHDYGIPGVVLMENAGRTTFQLLDSCFPTGVKGLKTAVVAGPGNNGGDGYVIARYLINRGADVDAFLLSPREKIKGDALINLKALEKMTPRITAVNAAPALDAAASVWRSCDVIVDAILGTGLTSEVRSPFRDAIERINECKAMKLAVDLPSGLDADSGKVLGAAVRADLTATYGFMKLGMALHPGLDYCGRVEVVDISIPLTAVEKNPPLAELYEQPDMKRLFRNRLNAEAHKGTFGHLLVVGGSPGKTGAPAMAARAATRIGAGLVTAAAPAELNPILEVKLTEEMTEPLAGRVSGYLDESCADQLLALAEGKRCAVVGPGLSTLDGVSDLVARILSGYPGWMVIDADGLNALARNLHALGNARSRVVLTPHPGEMARLAGKATKLVQEDRVGVARGFAAQHGVWVILKGARTIIAAPDGRITVNPSGNAWMASGGQGDALSGILGGLLVQGIPPEQALPFGVYLHGLAADAVLQRLGPAPVPAVDVIEELPRVLGSLW